MIRNNRIKFVISSILILLPIIAGVVLWDLLPDQLVIHWDLNNNPDGFAGKGVVVFCIPLILLAIHIVGIVVTALDKRNKDQNKKILMMSFFICPCISVLVSAVIYLHAFEKKLNVGSLAMILLGVIFISVGNYLPKTKNNYTIGIKLPWIMNSERVWNKTHRLSGFLWVICGIILLASSFMPVKFIPVILISVLVVAVGIPVVYSLIIVNGKK